MSVYKTSNYNLHNFLSDITLGYFKSKLLCKLGIHNYYLKIKKTVKPQWSRTDHGMVCIYNEESILIEECNCCKHIRENNEEV